MFKELKSEALLIACQTLPFIMITGIFIGIAYTFGDSFSGLALNDSADYIRYSCYYQP